MEDKIMAFSFLWRMMVIGPTVVMMASSQGFAIKILQIWFPHLHLCCLDLGKSLQGKTKKG
jgi:hypothetical protein